MQAMIKKFFIVSGLLATGTAFANVPVVDLATNSIAGSSAHLNQVIADPVQQSLSLDQRVVQLEQQMKNIVNMNLPNQIQQMQQQIQQLTGQLEVQTHNIKLLNQQQRNFYQDLDQRLSDLKKIVTAGSDSSSTTTTSPRSAVSTATTTASAAIASTKATDIAQEEDKAYQAAFKLLAAKEYEKAIASFQDFINNYPNGKYVVNAHYWLGEIYSLQKNNDEAVKQFTIVISQFPQSQKTPDAQFKMAVIHAQSGKIAEAKQELQQIVNVYPNTTAARLAKSQLEQLQ